MYDDEYIFRSNVCCYLWLLICADTNIHQGREPLCNSLCMISRRQGIERETLIPENLLLRVSWPPDLYRLASTHWSTGGSTERQVSWRQWVQVNRPLIYSAPQPADHYSLTALYNSVVTQCIIYLPTRSTISHKATPPKVDQAKARVILIIALRFTQQLQHG